MLNDEPQLRHLRTARGGDCVLLPALPGLGIGAGQFDSNWIGWPRMVIKNGLAYVFYTGNGEAGLRAIEVDKLTDWASEGGQTFDLLKPAAQ